MTADAYSFSEKKIQNRREKFTSIQDIFLGEQLADLGKLRFESSGKR